MNVIDFEEAAQAKKQAKSLKLLDIMASRVALEVCLKTINLNNLKELEKIKKEIKIAIKIIEEIQNAKKTN